MTTFNWQKLYRTIEEAQVEITASKAIFVYSTARGWKTGYYNFQQPIRQKSPLFIVNTLTENKSNYQSKMERLL